MSAPDPRSAIERFLQDARQPALLEPGEDLLPLQPGSYALEARASRLLLQAWDETRNLVRRVTGVRAETPGRLELVVEKFGKREGRLFLIDLARRAGHDAERRSGRLVFRERFRHMLTRQYPGWSLAELSADADLHHSLSPAFARAFLRQGQHGWAAIAAPAEGGEASGTLTFGLIWLDYLRRRERRVTVEGLALFLPAGEERTTCLRLPFLAPEAARYEVFSYSEEGFVARLDPRDAGNLDTELKPCRRAAFAPPELVERLLAIPGVERVPLAGGSLSLRVRGVEFAEVRPDGIRFGMAARTPAADHNAPEIEALARELARARDPESRDREHPLWRQHPEAWLESQVRARIETVDASLLPVPVYGQVPAFLGGERGVLDLLAVDRAGRLAVLELKASADPHLPLQALDYWMRVRHHALAGEFSAAGYFPGIALRAEPPRLLLVSPALDFHATTEAVLSFFSPAVEVERVGVGVEWRKELEVMFRLRGADRPEITY